MDKHDDLKAAVTRELEAARVVAAKAVREDRAFSESELRYIEDAKARAEVAKKALDQYRDEEHLKAQILAIGEGIGTDDSFSVAGSGREGPDGFVTGGYRMTGKSIASALTRAGMGQKSLVAAGSVAVPAERDPELYGEPSSPSFVHDLISAKTVSSNEVSYLRQSTATHLAAPVADGALKPTSIYTVTEQTATLLTLAHLSEYVPNRIFADSPALLAWLQDEMAVGIELAAENAAVAAILATSGTQAQVFSVDPIVTIRKAVTKLTAKRFKPDVLIVNLLDAEALDLTQDNQDRFYFGGPNNQGFGASGVWSVPVIQTDAVAAGAAILANLKASTRRYVRDDARFDLDSATHFDTNESRGRVERREVTVVTRPFGIVEVDLSP